MNAIKKAFNFAKKETVLIVAMLLAVISAFFVTPDKAYASYIDFRTLGLLFSLMTVTEGCKGLGIFERSAKFIISKVNTAFQLSIVLVGLCFFSSMFITNDVSLLTFVPLTLTALSTLGEAGNKLLIPIVVLQTIAANLGSMLTPIGNPQNLYLFGVSDMKLEDFLVLMLPFTIVAGAMLFLWILAVCKKSGKLSVKTDITAENFDTYSTKDKTKLSGYVLLFVLCLLTVARLIPWQIAALCALAFSAIAERNVLKTVDYSLLLTFCGFFIFIGNMGRVEIFRSVLSSIINGHELFIAVAASQIISNVPCAILLSGFTNKLNALIIGTNIGGLGTLIASMASLISYKQICRSHPHIKGRYFVYFTAANIAFLAVMALTVKIAY